MEFIKVTANIRYDEIVMVEQLAAQRGSTRTEAIRTAIRTANLLHEATMRGAEILIEQPCGCVKQLVFKI
jgi:hypothetical protein